MSLNNFQIKSRQNASSFLRLKYRRAKDNNLHDYVQTFLLRHNGNTALLVERLLDSDFEKKQAFDPEFIR
jgi:hypothetical protein